MKWDESLYIEPVKTFITETDAVMHLRESWRKFYGSYPHPDSLAILWSQTILETGRFKISYCYNMGNEKSRPNDGHHWTMYKCSEILIGPDGKKREYFFEPPHDQCKFRAFHSAQEGFDHYFKFVATRKRYKEAWSYVLKGDVVNYTKSLKKAGYFTASLNLYMKGMTRLNAEFHRRAAELLGGGNEIGSKEEVAQIFTDEEKAEIALLVNDTTDEAIDRYFSLTDRAPDEEFYEEQIRDPWDDPIEELPQDALHSEPPAGLHSDPPVVGSEDLPQASNNMGLYAVIAAIGAGISYLIAHISNFF